MDQPIARWIAGVPNIIPCVGSGKASHSKVKHPKAPFLIREWKDFNIQTMLDMDESVLGPVWQDKPDSDSCEIHGRHRGEEFDPPFAEPDLDGALIESVKRTLNCALAHTQDYLRDQGRLTNIPRPGIQLLRGSGARIVRGDAGNQYKPDWAGGVVPELEKARVQLSKYRVVGDTKLYWKCDFEDLNRVLVSGASLKFADYGRKAKSDKKMLEKFVSTNDKFYDDEYHGVRQALIQVYTYCCATSCRYGFVITEKQLLVMRLRPLRSRLRNDGTSRLLVSELERYGLIECKLIDFNPAEDNKFNAIQALWWLLLLGVAAHKIEWQYSPLSEVTLSQNAKGQGENSSKQPLKRKRDPERSDSPVHALERVRKAAKTSTGHHSAAESTSNYETIASLGKGPRSSDTSAGSERKFVDRTRKKPIPQSARRRTATEPVSPSTESARKKLQVRPDPVEQELQAKTKAITASKNPATLKLNNASANAQLNQIKFPESKPDTNAPASGKPPSSKHRATSGSIQSDQPSNK